MSRKQVVNLKFTGLMIAFNLMFVFFTAYGSYYLLEKGLNSAQVGIVIAVSSALASVIQPLLAERADRSKRWSLLEFNLLAAIPALILIVALLFSSQTILRVATIYTLLYTFFLLLQPLMNSISAFFTKRGIAINYNVAKGIGSLFYSIASLFLDHCLQKMSVDGLLVFIFIFYLLYIFMLFTLKLPQAKQELVPLDEEEQGHEGALSTVEFLRCYPQFKWLLTGIVCFFIFQKVKGVYMIQFLESVGGNESQLGLAFAVTTFVEIPAALLYPVYVKRTGNARALLFSAVAYLIKSLIFFFAWNVAGIMLAQVFQFFTYGILSIVVVYYTAEQVDEKNLVKGQTLLITAKTIGIILGSLGGGLIIEYVSLSGAKLFSVCACAIGLYCFYRGLRKDIRG